MRKELVLLKTSLLAAIPQPPVFENGCFLFVSNSGSFTTSGQWGVFFPQPLLLGVFQDFRWKLKSCHQQWGTPITWTCLIRAGCKTLLFIACWHGFVSGAPFDISSASLMACQRTSWVRFPFRTSWPLFSLAEMLAGFCSLGTISGNQVASAWVWKVEQKSTQAVGSFTNWDHSPQELGLSLGHWHIAVHCSLGWTNGHLMMIWATREETSSNVLC